MPRLLSLAAVALSASVFAASPAALSAADNGVYYTARLAAPAADARYVAGGRLWLCAGDSCRAQRSTDRPLRVCREFKRTVGAVTEFTVDGAPLDAEQLARCNS